MPPDIEDLMMKTINYCNNHPPASVGERLSIMATQDGVHPFPILNPLPLGEKTSFLLIEYRAVRDWEWTPTSGKVIRLTWRVYQTIRRSIVNDSQRKKFEEKDETTDLN